MRGVQYATDIDTSSSLRKWSSSRAAYPVYQITLNFNFLRPADHITLRSFFEAHKGRSETFLFDDRDDRLQNDSGTYQVFGLGDGVRTKWQLVRQQGGQVMPIGRHNTIAAVRNAGVVTGAYSLDNFGSITFSSPRSRERA